MNAIYRDGKVYYRGGFLGALTFVRYMDKTDYKLQQEEFFKVL